MSDLNVILAYILVAVTMLVVGEALGVFLVVRFMRLSEKRRKAKARTVDAVITTGIANGRYP